MNRQAYVSFEQVLTDMWAPCHMNTIFFEQMLIHQFKLFQALVSSTTCDPSPGPMEVMSGDLILGGVTLEESEAITQDVAILHDNIGDTRLRLRFVRRLGLKVPCGNLVAF